MTPAKGFDRVEDAIADIKKGRMVVVVDDPDRENEGDIIIAAEKCDVKAVNFMAVHARGLICVPLPASRLEALNKEFGSQLLISASVREALGDDGSDAVALGEVEVRGYERPVAVFQLG